LEYDIFGFWVIYFLEPIGLGSLSIKIYDNILLLLADIATPIIYLPNLRL